MIGSYDPESGQERRCNRRPHLIGSSPRSELVLINNPSYWRISGLELSSGAVGLRVHYTTVGHRSIELDGLVVHDFKGIFRGDCKQWPHAYTALGVLFDHSLRVLPQKPQAVLRDVQINDLEGYHNQGSLGMSGYGCAAHTATSSYLYNQVTLQDLFLHDDAGPAPACSDGLQLITVSQAKILDSRFEREGGCFTESGTTGVIVGESSDVAFINDVFAGTPVTKSPDQSGMDLEAHTRGVSVRGSYFGDNAGSGLEFLTISGPENFHTGIDVSDNVFSRNTKSPLAGTGEAGHIWRGGDAPEPSGRVQENLYSKEVPFAVGRMPSISFAHNSASSLVSASALDWARSDGLWTVAQLSAGAWTTMQRHGDRFQALDGCTVTRFRLQASDSADCTVARVWEAPRAGFVAVRGVARTGAAQPAIGASVSIRTGSDISLEATASTAIGAPTRLDRLRVAKGQKVYFEVTLKARGAVSWVPAVGYVD